MALDTRILEMVEVSKAMAQRRVRRNEAIAGACFDADDSSLDMDSLDEARDELDFIQRIESYTAGDISRFAALVEAYLENAPTGDAKRITDNLRAMLEAVAT